MGSPYIKKQSTVDNLIQKSIQISPFPKVLEMNSGIYHDFPLKQIETLVQVPPYISKLFGNIYKNPHPLDC